MSTALEFFWPSSKLHEGQQNKVQLLLERSPFQIYSSPDSLDSLCQNCITSLSIFNDQLSFGPTSSCSLCNKTRQRRGFWTINPCSLESLYLVGSMNRLFKVFLFWFELFLLFKQSWGISVLHCHRFSFSFTLNEVGYLEQFRKITQVLYWKVWRKRNTACRTVV